jgi:hypothetical protein
MGGNMRRTVIAAIFALVTVIGCTSLAAAASEDPVVGTWQLNASKSKFTTGPAVKSQTRTYSQSKSGISLELKSVGADGNESTTTTTYHLNGKAYPITGNPDYDTLTGTKVNSHTAKFTLKRGGKVVGHTTRTVSKDGKTLTATTKLTAAGGEKTDSVLVFDRQ